MLTLLLCAGLLIGKPADTTMANATVKDVRDTLAVAGYKVTTGKVWYVQHLTRRAHKGMLVVQIGENNTNQPLKDDAPAKVVVFRFELAVPQTLDSTAPFQMKEATMSTADVPQYGSMSPEPVFTPHIGDTVTVEAGIRNVWDLTRKEFIAKVDRVWDAVDEYAKQAHAKIEPLDDPSRPTLRDADKRIVAYPDELSLWRLTDYWGWTYRKSAGGSSPGWMFPTSIGEKTVWLHQYTHNTKPGDKAFSVSLTLDTTLPDAKAWWSDHKDLVAWASIFPGPGKSQLGIWAEVTLTPKTTAADVKREVLSFVERVEKLAKERGWAVGG